MRTIYDRLIEIIPKITDPSFKESKGLGKEVGYHIFDYDPKDEMTVRKHIPYIKKEISEKHQSLSIIECNLFKIVLQILEDKGYLEKNFTMEQKRSSNFVLNATRKSLRLTLENDLVINHIRNQAKNHDILFITGVGEVFPIIRSHVILNNIHRAVDDQPVIMFYPGKYSGQDLQLFSEISDGNYYRAFRLID